MLPIFQKYLQTSNLCHKTKCHERFALLEIRDIMSFREFEGEVKSYLKIAYLYLNKFGTLLRHDTSFEMSLGKVLGQGKQA